MTTINLQCGNVVMVDGEVSTSSDCCCGCPINWADLEGQTVSFTSDCPCISGELSGSGSLVVDQTPCDDGSAAAMIETGCVWLIDGGVELYSVAIITVSCCDCPTGGRCLQVSFQAYVYDPVSGYSVVSGQSSCGADLEVIDGVITGNVTITGTYPPAGTCTINLTFG